MDERTKAIYKFISDFWQLIKKYIELPNTDEEWDTLTDEASELSKKHKAGDTPESQFFNKCIVDWLEYLNKREIRRKKGTEDP